MLGKRALQNIANNSGLNFMYIKFFKIMSDHYFDSRSSLNGEIKFNETL